MNAVMTEATEVETIGRATYSPEDNKLRIYPDTRLDRETYDRVKEAGYKWAPKQGIFVAPMWTPARADLAAELCGEIGDEDTSLVERATERADRFEGYSEKRADDAHRARESVSAIADGILLGQPILVGHHSEHHARRDAKRIENGMRKAVQMWETSEYWTHRAAGALRAAKYKELPGVRARRIKGIEADKRKAERDTAEVQKWLHLWAECGAIADQAEQHARALQIANVCRLSMPRKEGDAPDFNQRPDVYTVLNNSYPNLYAPRTVAEVIEHAGKVYPRLIAHYARWIAHYTNRLAYENAMLEEQGATHLLAKKPKSAAASLPLCNYMVADGLDVENMYHRGEFSRYPQVVMTKAEYAKIYADYKGTRVIGNSHRVRTAYYKGAHVCVFLSDSKTHEPPAAVECMPRAVPHDPAPRLHVVPVDTLGPSPKEEEAAPFKAMRDSLRTGAGVQVVTANQLFPTPADLAARMVEMADIQPGHDVLEPSGGTGNIIRAIQSAQSEAALVAVEVKQHLADVLRGAYRVPTHCRDFLECGGELGTFDRIIMNPPFENASDIKHILHARSMLKPGGMLVAICAAGPRQKAELEPIASYWEELPAGTFAGTGVRTVLLAIEG